MVLGVFLCGVVVLSFCSISTKDDVETDVYTNQLLSHRAYARSLRWGLASAVTGPVKHAVAREVSASGDVLDTVPLFV
jgi:hypothetical protein